MSILFSIGAYFPFSFCTSVHNLHELARNSLRLCVRFSTIEWLPSVQLLRAFSCVSVFLVYFVVVDCCVSVTLFLVFVLVFFLSFFHGVQFVVGGVGGSVGTLPTVLPTSATSNLTPSLAW